MRTVFIFWLALLSSTAATSAETPKLPKGAIQLDGAEIVQWLNGKTFRNVVIYDASVPITATTNWNSTKMRVSGTYVAGGNKGKFDNEWIINGDTSCTEKTADGKWICQKVFMLGDVMYEVNRKGKLHAISKP
ncbi:hypothetical protein [Aliiruegeria lutimaris]|uniref:DUF995 domain-containing protein n=1 Tax=Aliiruegeria lutimaris TaxID=571298 RepID=A0A1G9M9L5_9RHOB|nr:hypothetical protein [Aliiruegeria lutimaris]SDL70647.1 hypothetical protein SAMN04488026_110713 [Aliiruegeria lutimaris]